MWLRGVVCTTETESLNECTFILPIGYGQCNRVLAVDCGKLIYFMYTHFSIFVLCFATCRGPTIRAAWLWHSSDSALSTGCDRTGGVVVHTWEDSVAEEKNLLQLQQVYALY